MHCALDENLATGGDDVQDKRNYGTDDRNGTYVVVAAAGNVWLPTTQDPSDRSDRQPNLSTGPQHHFDSNTRPGGQ